MDKSLEKWLTLYIWMNSHYGTLSCCGSGRTGTINSESGKVPDPDPDHFLQSFANKKYFKKFCPFNVLSSSVATKMKKKKQFYTSSV